MAWDYGSEGSGCLQIILRIQGFRVFLIVSGVKMSGVVVKDRGASGWDQCLEVSGAALSYHSRALHACRHWCGSERVE